MLLRLEPKLVSGAETERSRPNAVVVAGGAQKGDDLDRAV